MDSSSAAELNSLGYRDGGGTLVSIHITPVLHFFGLPDKLVAEHRAGNAG
jgi:hypothetical protein